MKEWKWGSHSSPRQEHQLCWAWLCLTFFLLALFYIKLILISQHWKNGWVTLFFLKDFFSFHLCVWGSGDYVYIECSTCRGEKEIILEHQELQVVVICMVGTRNQTSSSMRAVWALNCWDISPVSNFLSSFKKKCVCIQACECSCVCKSICIHVCVHV